MYRIIKLLIFVLLFSPLFTPLHGETLLRVAVAANFIQPFNEITAEFEKKTGIKVEGVFTSSGNLYNQIVNGAPYDIFLSADEERPEKLFNSDLSEKPFVYARGTVILWTGKKNLNRIKTWYEFVEDQEVKRIAIANPATAPYGASALIAMEKKNLKKAVESKLVTAQNIAQSFQYASTGSVDAAFCALSASLSEQGKKGWYYTVEEAPLIIQSACLLKRSKNFKAAEKFVEFLQSSEAEKIKLKYGYK